MSILGGLSPNLRRRYSEILRATSGTVTPTDAARILGLENRQAAKLLAHLAALGWLARVRRGLYVPVSVESQSPTPAIDDPWLIASKAFAPCYIGGWSAAEHWDLTEQIFRSTLVMTSTQRRSTELTLQGAPFRLRTVPAAALTFGLQTVWRGRSRVSVSTPSRTIIDMLHDPALGGGIRPVADVLVHYLRSPHKDLAELIRCAENLANGAVFKRLGFLLERFIPEEKDAALACRTRLTAGLAKLDPVLSANHLVPAWRLLIPESWTNAEVAHDQ